MATPKILIVGDPEVGKTHLIEEIMSSCGMQLWGRDKEYRPTIGVKVHCLVHHDQMVKLWDCGSPIYGIVEDYFDNAHGAIVVGPLRDWGERVVSVTGGIPVVRASVGTPVNEIVRIWK